MATLKDLEDNLKAFIVQEQSDAHHRGGINTAKYNNIKLSMNPSKNPMPHITIRISISEATFLLSNFTKYSGGLGFEERFILKWFGRYGIKQKLTELWSSIEIDKDR